MEEKRNIALLIDCDNASYTKVEGVLEELANYGEINIRNAYGDWNSDQMNGWRKVHHAHAITPVQQFSYTRQKNATDIAMIIDAMDILYAGNMNAFALMSSDSDFTPLVLRIRENGFPIYGFGKKSTPEPFVEACTKFIHTENLQDEGEPGETEGAEGAGKPMQRQSGNILKQDTALIKKLRTAVENTSGDDGWASLSVMGRYISNHSPFSEKNYGYGKLSELVKAIDLFETETKNNAIYVRDLRNKKVAKQQTTKKKTTRKVSKKQD